MQLPNFDFNVLFPAANGNEEIISSETTQKHTIKLMGKVVSQTLNQTKEFANWIKQNYPEKEKQLKFLWLFCRPINDGGFINYRDDDDLGKSKEKEREEWVRSPARTIYDRIIGVDCDCISVFQASVLTNLGFDWVFRTGGDLPNEPEHVWTCAKHKNQLVCLDPNPVIPKYNQEHNFKFKNSHDMTKYLSGLSGCFCNQTQTLSGISDQTGLFPRNLPIEEIKENIRENIRHIQNGACLIPGLAPDAQIKMLVFYHDHVGRPTQPQAEQKIIQNLGRIYSGILSGGITGTGPTAPTPPSGGTGTGTGTGTGSLPFNPNDLTSIMQMIQGGQPGGSAGQSIGSALGGTGAGIACAVFGIPPAMCSQVGSMVGGLVGSFFGNPNHRCDGKNVSEYGKYLQRLALIDGPCTLDNGDANGYGQAIQSYAWGPLMVWAHYLAASREKQLGFRIDFKGSLWVITRPVANASEAPPMNAWLSDWSTFINAVIIDDAKNWRYRQPANQQPYPYAPWGTNLNWNQLPPQLGGLKMPEGYPMVLQARIMGQAQNLPQFQQPAPQPTQTGNIQITLPFNFQQPYNQKKVAALALALAAASGTNQALVSIVTGKGEQPTLDNFYNAAFWNVENIPADFQAGLAHPLYPQLARTYLNAPSDAPASNTPAAPTGPLPPSSPPTTPQAREEEKGIGAWIKENTALAIGGAVIVLGGLYLATRKEKPARRRSVSGVKSRRYKKPRRRVVTKIS